VARTLVVTNDFPPRIGGIESFVADLCALLDDDVVVLTSGPPGAGATDASRGYPVVRRGGLLLPTPAVTREAVRLLRQEGADRVLFGAAAPLGCWPRLCAGPAPGAWSVSPTATRWGGRGCRRPGRRSAGSARTATT
jgi:hypothetical protein